MKIDFDSLVTESAIDVTERRGGRPRPVAIPGCERPVHVASCPDVLYLPGALDAGKTAPQNLQVVDQRYVPLEAVLWAFTLEFVQEQRREKGFTAYNEPFEVDRVDDTVCILGNVFSRNFTHWHEELMKVLIVEAAGIDCRYVSTRLPGFAGELLTLLGIGPERRLEVERPTVFAEAVYTTPIRYADIVEYTGVFMALREVLLGVDVSDEPGLGERLWLTRGAHTRLGRTLVNEEEVFRLLEPYDFTFVDMGDLPLRSQMAAARAATVLAGPHGSHHVHSQLMAPGSAIIECFSPLYLNPTYTEIYRVLRHHYWQISSRNTPAFPYAHGGDVDIDCSHLELALSEAIAGSAREPEGRGRLRDRLRRG